jgi:signal transduction histidine kinase
MEETMPVIEKNNQTPCAVLILFFTLTVCCFVGSALAANESQNQEEQEQSQVLRGHHLFLNQAMDQVFSVVESILNEPDLDKPARLRRVKNFLRVARYGPENKDYFSIIDPQGKVILDPYNPQYEGKDLTEFTDLNGQQMFKDILMTIDEKGEGYINHQWPRYDQMVAVPKITFVRKHSKLPIIILTGLYLDTIEAYEIPFAGLTMPFDDKFIDDRKTASPVVSSF